MIRVSNLTFNQKTQTDRHFWCVVDVGACSAKDILVSHTPGAVDDATATTGIYLTLSALRQFHRAEKNVRAGKWKAGLSPARDPEGKVVGVIGMGGIGSVSVPSEFQWIVSLIIGFPIDHGSPFRFFWDDRPLSQPKTHQPSAVLPLYLLPRPSRAPGQERCCLPELASKRQNQVSVPFPLRRGYSQSDDR